MDKSDVISLIKNERYQDQYGVWKSRQTSRNVYCQIDSVTQNEFFEGGRNGLNPEYKITIFLYDYDDESVIEYNGKQYSIYRTYKRRDDQIELYVERKGGTNKAEVPSV